MPDDPSGGTADEERESILRRLRDVAARVDPVPAAVEVAAKAAVSRESFDGELAELVFDSAVDAGGLPGARRLSFRAPGSTVALEVWDAGSRRHLACRLEPPWPATLEVRHAAGALIVQAAANGHFAADVPAGPVSLAFAAQEGVSVATEWVVI